MLPFNTLSARVAVLSAFTLLASSVSARANTITVTNGSFEQTTAAGSQEIGQNGTGDQVTGWQASGYSFVFTPGTADTTGAVRPNPTVNTNVALWGSNNGGLNAITTSPSGGNFLAMDPVYQAPSSVSQTLNGLTVGALTTVSFYYAGAEQLNYTGATTEGFAVTLGSQTLNTPTLNDVSKGFTGWNAESLTFTATSSSELLTFLSTGGPTGGPPFALLDGVSVTDNTTAVTPEPNSLALLGTGLVCVGGLLRKRFAKA